MPQGPSGRVLHTKTGGHISHSHAYRVDLTQGNVLEELVQRISRRFTTSLEEFSEGRGGVTVLVKLVVNPRSNRSWSKPLEATPVSSSEFASRCTAMAETLRQAALAANESSGNVDLSIEIRRIGEDNN